MAKSNRLWIPLDVNFQRDAKILEAGRPAAWLYLAVLCLIQEMQQRGVLTRRQIAQLGHPKWQDSVEKLVRVGLLEQLPEDRYLVPAWDEWHVDNPQRAEYMRKWRAKRQQQQLRAVEEDADD